MGTTSNDKEQAKNSLGINISVRLKNPWFWIGTIGVLLTSMDITSQNCSTWVDLFDLIITALQNPFKVGSTVVAFLGVVVDPTTTGIGDSTRALTYTKPKR